MYEKNAFSSSINSNIDLLLYKRDKILFYQDFVLFN